MATFVKEGTKGAVGTLTKAESLIAVDGSEIDLTILKAELPDNLDTLVEDIKGSHKTALGQIGRAIVAAARAGQLLLAAKSKLPKGKAFTEWLAETFDFSQRTAYDYIEVSAKVASRAEEIAKCKSIRDVLKLGDSEDLTKKKKRDVRRETFVTYAAKIERWWTEEKAKVPLEDWDATRKETCAKMLEGVVRIYNELVS